MMFETGCKKKVAKGSMQILNARGLHTRPSTEIVKCATSYKAEVYLYYQDNFANAKSLLGIMMLAAGQGAKIDVVAKGEDADEALTELLDLAKQQFYMSY